MHQEDELRALLDKKPHPVCYDGFEPSGRMHIAQGVLKSINVRATCCCLPSHCMGKGAPTTPWGTQGHLHICRGVVVVVVVVVVLLWWRRRW
jgi:hypothetical protein